MDGAAKYEVQYTTDAVDAATVTWTALTAVTETTQSYTPEAAPACGDVYRFRGAGLRGRGDHRGGLGRHVGGHVVGPQLSPGLHRCALPLHGGGGRGGGRGGGDGHGHGPGCGRHGDLRPDSGEHGKRLRPGREHRGHHRGGGAGLRDDGQLPPDGGGQ